MARRRIGSVECYLINWWTPDEGRCGSLVTDTLASVRAQILASAGQQGEDLGNGARLKWMTYDVSLDASDEDLSSMASSEGLGSVSCYRISWGEGDGEASLLTTDLVDPDRKVARASGGRRPWVARPERLAVDLNWVCEAAWSRVYAAQALEADSYEGPPSPGFPTEEVVETEGEEC